VWYTPAMPIRIKGVKWRETIDIVRDKNTIVIQIMTKAGRLFRSTSFRLNKKEALKLAAELHRKASS
jgi:GMP synthase PP-ATPase subunit